MLNCYLVFMPKEDERVVQTFKDTHHPIASHLWAVATPIATCVEVCESLGIHDELNMIVVPMSEYYGRHDRALWQKLEAWREEA